MDQWFGVGVEIQCYSIYQGQGLLEGDHLESRQNDRSTFGLSYVCQDYHMCASCEQYQHSLSYL